ncbi:sigma factor-like helix-turn-helix DNA-binding protein [Streptomyces polygonati]|uniref:Sigma factor-like helix-turn-helix DNA-binding protein n=1 Tax=Streptomyces polygonati TaxID=1617087 RepID=A0ABV8HQ24_9ACTN
MTARKKRGKAPRARGGRPSRPAEPPHEAPPPRATGRSASPAGQDSRPAAADPPAATGPERVPAQTYHPVAAAIPAPAARPDSGRQRPRTPEAAFDALYLHAAGPLLRQVELLTGVPPFARHVVTHAFGLAWQRWPEVARDSDPVGWVRAAAYDYALAPWQCWALDRRLRLRVPGCPQNTEPRFDPQLGPRLGPQLPPGRQDPLEAALLELPPVHRRALLLHDGLGLGLRETAAEIEASTLATAARIARAREALAEAVLEPELEPGPPEALSARLGALLRRDGDTPEPPDRPEAVRAAGEHGVRLRTVGALTLTGLIAAVTTLTIALAPAHGPRAATVDPVNPVHSVHSVRPVHADVPAAGKPIRDRAPATAPGGGTQRRGPAPR